jgi:hypothetical protein
MTWASRIYHDESRLRGKACARSVACEGVAFAIMYTGDERNWPHDWIMDFGLVHEPCLRLTVQHCPVVSAWESMRLLRLAVEDTVLTEDMQRTVPLDRHHDLSVDVESFR